MSFWQFSSHSYEYFFDLFSLFGWALHICEVFFFAKLVDFLQGNSSLILKIGFVTDKEKYSIFLSVHLDFVHPKLNNTIEWRDVCNVEYKKYALTASVISTCDCSESLLSCSIPNLELDAFIINGESFESEIDSNSSEIMLRKLILYEPYENSWLSNTWVSNDDSFEKMIVLFDHICSFIITLINGLIKISDSNLLFSLFTLPLLYYCLFTEKIKLKIISKLMNFIEILSLNCF